jgi:hypothetical protein
MKLRVTLRRRRAIGLALAACSLALTAPAAAGAVEPSGNTDLRSADARDAALAAEQAAPSVDLRSPDTRDATSAAASGSTSAPASPAPEEPTVVSVVDHGSQTLAIVLASTALVIAVVAIAFAALFRRPRPRWSAS